MVWPLWKPVLKFCEKLKIELLYDPKVPLLDIYQIELKTWSRKKRDNCNGIINKIYSKKLKTWPQRDICTPSAASLITARTWKEPKCPSMIHNTNGYTRRGTYTQ